jgi:hypothetical protein
MRNVASYLADEVDPAYPVHPVFFILLCFILNNRETLVSLIPEPCALRTLRCKSPYCFVIIAMTCGSLARQYPF